MMKRLLLTLGWASVLAYFTCSINPFQFGLSGFQFNPNAHFSDLLIMDIHVTEFDWTFTKIGHFLGFFIMDMLLYSLISNRVIAAVSAISLAVSTELFQLYFARDGRVYDMFIDSFGVALSYLLQPMVSRYLSRRYRR